MSNDTRIMVLCNNEMAIPAMQQLYMGGHLQAVIVPEKNKSLYGLFQQMLSGTGLTLAAVNKKNLEPVLEKIAIEKNISTAWLMTFAYIIPPSLLNLLPGGFINFHYGLLPQYRGANPVLAQMLQGEKESGITIHRVDENIDTGPVILQQKIAIAADDTFGMQLQKLGMLGAAMAQQLLQLYRSGPLPPSLPQDESQARYYKKPTARDLMINWETMNSEQIIRLINACNPWNKGAGTIIHGRVICFTHAEIVADKIEEKKLPGTIAGLDEQQGLCIICSDDIMIRVNIIYTPEGIFPGYKLASVGVKINDKFITG